MVVNFKDVPLFTFDLSGYDIPFLYHHLVPESPLVILISSESLVNMILPIEMPDYYNY